MSENTKISEDLIAISRENEKIMRSRERVEFAQKEIDLLSLEMKELKQKIVAKQTAIAKQDVISIQQKIIPKRCFSVCNSKTARSQIAAISIIKTKNKLPSQHKHNTASKYYAVRYPYAPITQKLKIKIDRYIRASLKIIYKGGYCCDLFFCYAKCRRYFLEFLLPIHFTL
jgi:hypothetical protein